MVRVCSLLEEAAMRWIETGRERIDMESLSDDLTTHTLVSISDRGADVLPDEYRIPLHR
jgi:hypothetical protein